MHSEMRVPAAPQLEHFKATLDTRLRFEVAQQKRAIFPAALTALTHRLKMLVKPLLQSGAMAMTAIVIIIGISATPAAITGDLDIPMAAPLSAPDARVLIESGASFLDVPADDVLAIPRDGIDIQNRIPP